MGVFTTSCPGAHNRRALFCRVARRGPRNGIGPDLFHRMALRFDSIAHHLASTPFVFVYLHLFHLLLRVVRVVSPSGLVN